eukprot:31181-Pelagococcus_subviridis.AAC.15
MPSRERSTTREKTARRGRCARTSGTSARAWSSRPSIASGGSRVEVGRPSAARTFFVRVHVKEFTARERERRLDRTRPDSTAARTQSTFSPP